MDTEAFRATLGDPRPPAGLPPLVEALWHDARGDWERAHSIAQEINDADGCWVHGYLHRVEGDMTNAAYWYRRAGRSFPEISLPDEWTAIAGALLGRQGERAGAGSA